MTEPSVRSMPARRPLCIESRPMASHRDRVLGGSRVQCTHVLGLTLKTLDFVSCPIVNHNLYTRTSCRHWIECGVHEPLYKNVQTKKETRKLRIMAAAGACERAGPDERRGRVGTRHDSFISCWISAFQTHHRHFIRPLSPACLPTMRENIEANQSAVRCRSVPNSSQL